MTTTAATTAAMATSGLFTAEDIALYNVYAAAKARAEAMILPGAEFKGAFGVARDMGLTRDTREWDWAVEGAMWVFSRAKIVLNKEGRIV